MLKRKNVKSRNRTSLKSQNKIHYNFVIQNKNQSQINLQCDNCKDR